MVVVGIFSDFFILLWHWCTFFFIFFVNVIEQLYSKIQKKEKVRQENEDDNFLIVEFDLTGKYASVDEAVLQAFWFFNVYHIITWHWSLLLYIFKAERT